MVLYLGTLLGDNSGRDVRSTDATAGLLDHVSDLRDILSMSRRRCCEIAAHLSRWLRVQLMLLRGILLVYNVLRVHRFSYAITIFTALPIC